MQILVEIGWASVTIFSLEIIFTQTGSMAGWSKGEVFIIYAIYRLVSSLGAIFFRNNVSNLITLVNSGDLDLVITKPINSFFLVFSRIVAIDRISQVAVALTVFYYATQLTNFTWNITLIFQLIILVICGAIIRFSFSAIVHSLVFWLENLENLERLELTLFGTARFPRQAFPPTMRHFFTFIIPVMFVAAIPSEIILNKSPQILFFGVILLTLAISSIAYRFFNFALRHYSSASS